MSMLLCFEMSDALYEDVRRIAGDCGVGTKRIGREKYNLPLATLMFAPAEPIARRPYGGKEKPAPFTEPMMVLCPTVGRTDDDAFLDALRVFGVGKNVLKAYLTKVNREWTPVFLYGHLCMERDAYARAQKAEKEKRNKQ